MASDVLRDMFVRIGVKTDAAQFSQVKKSIDGVKAGLVDMAKGAAILGGGFWLLKRTIIDTVVEFERYAAILQVTEGSAEAAKKSLEWVQDFAKRTPYEVGEVTAAFVKLRAYGMDPTSGLLMTLGDTAAAMGKELIQAVDAIANAVTGENERLKQFGINARQEGDTIVYEYTQNGKTMTASAKKSSREMIQTVLSGIMNQKFTGAMEIQSKTMGGMISNMSYAWTQLVKEIGEGGINDEIKKGVKMLSGVFAFLQKNIKAVIIAVKVFAAAVAAIGFSFIIIGIAKVAMGLSAMAVAFGLAGKAGLIAFGRMLVVPLIIGAGIVSIIMLVQDMWLAITDPTAITQFGSILKHWEDRIRGWVDAIKELFGLTGKSTTPEQRAAQAAGRAAAPGVFTAPQVPGSVLPSSVAVSIGQISIDAQGSDSKEISENIVRQVTEKLNGARRGLVGGY